MNKEYETTCQNSCYYAWNLNKVVQAILTIATAGNPGHLLPAPGEWGWWGWRSAACCAPQTLATARAGTAPGKRCRVESQTPHAQWQTTRRATRASETGQRHQHETTSQRMQWWRKIAARHTQQTLRLRETGRWCKLFCGPAVKFGRDNRGNVSQRYQHLFPTDHFMLWHVTCIHNRLPHPPTPHPPHIPNDLFSHILTLPSIMYHMPDLFFIDFICNTNWLLNDKLIAHLARVLDNNNNGYLEKSFQGRFKKNSKG